LFVSLPLLDDSETETETAPELELDSDSDSVALAEPELLPLSVLVGSVALLELPLVSAVVIESVVIESVVVESVVIVTPVIESVPIESVADIDADMPVVGSGSVVGDVVSSTSVAVPVAVDDVSSPHASIGRTRPIEA
jgi:hypothetical protein